MFLTWAPIEGDHNYTTNTKAAVVVNYTIKQVVATPHVIAGTPGKGKNRTGE